MIDGQKLSMCHLVSVPEVLIKINNKFYIIFKEFLFDQGAKE